VERYSLLILVIDMPIHDLTIEITNRCNLFCKQCDIWKERPFFDLDVATIDKLMQLLDSPIQNVSLTGGEVFSHPHFEEIFSYMLKHRIKKRIRGLNLVSNGYAHEAIIRLLTKYKKYGKHFDMDFSVDGKEKNHNFQRGAKDAYKKTIKTMLSVRKLFPLMKISLKYTINNQNYDDLPDLYKFCKKYKFHLYPKLIEAGTNNYYHRLGGERVLPIADIQSKSSEIIAVLEELKEKDKGEVIEQHILSLLIKKLRGLFTLNACFTPEKSLFLTARGDIYSCLYYDKLCNINEKDWKEKLKGEYQQKILKESACGKCPGCFAYHGFLKSYNINHYLKV